MTRTLIGSFALGAVTLLYPAVGSAQTHVDVGVWTPGGGGRVVIGGGPVYYPAPYYEAPVYYPPAPVYYPPPAYYPAQPVYAAPRAYYRPYYGRYYAAPRPVYVVPGYRHDNGRHNGWYKNGKAYRGYGNGYSNVRYSDGRRGGHGRRR